MSVPASRRRKRLAFRFNVHHKWVRRFNPESQDYLQCVACGKERGLRAGADAMTSSATSRTLSVAVRCWSRPGLAPPPNTP
jgi:hypothetical protein